MGASSSDPITYVNDAGKTGYNGSPYTYGQPFPMIVDNYPWVIFEDGNTMSEVYSLRLYLETSCWGVLAFLLEIASNIAGIALAADPEFPNGVGNDKGVYTVAASWYTIVPIIRIV